MILYINIYIKFKINYSIWNSTTLLTIILSSLLSALSNPVVSNNEITEESTLNKRAVLCGFLWSPKYTKDDWRCCNFKCDKESSWACRSECLTYKADLERNNPWNNCRKESSWPNCRKFN